MKANETERKPIGLSHLLIFCLACGIASAQVAKAQTSGVEILKLKWEKQIKLPRNFDPSVIPDGQVFTGLEARTAVPGTTASPNGADNQARADAAARSRALAPVDYFPNTPGRMPVYYVYSLKIRNAGPKTVVGVAWDYVFLDPDTKAVLGNHQLFNYTKASSGQIVNLRAQQRTRPVTIVKAQSPNSAKDSGKKDLERAVIQCVLYSDGGIWKNPVGRDSACELLRKNQPLRIKNEASLGP